VVFFENPKLEKFMLLIVFAHRHSVAICSKPKPFPYPIFCGFIVLLILLILVGLLSHFHLTLFLSSLSLPTFPFLVNRPCLLKSSQPFVIVVIFFLESCSRVILPFSTIIVSHDTKHCPRLTR
jgi:hypothetical protein